MYLFSTSVGIITWIFSPSTTQFENSSIQCREETSLQLESRHPASSDGWSKVIAPALSCFGFCGFFFFWFIFWLFFKLTPFFCTPPHMHICLFHHSFVFFPPVSDVDTFLSMICYRSRWTDALMNRFNDIIDISPGVKLRFGLTVCGFCGLSNRSRSMWNNHPLLPP